MIQKLTTACLDRPDPSAALPAHSSAVTLCTWPGSYWGIDS